MRRRKTRSKSITLSEKIWLRNSKDIAEYRNQELEEQGGKCAVSGVKLDVGVLDHTHKDGCGKDGACRGVLLSEINMLEGRYLQLFKRLKLDTKYDLDFPTFLIKLGTYLQQDNTSAPLHFKYMDDFRKHIKRYRKDTLVSRLKSDFGVYDTDGMLVNDLVQMYVQLWVNRIEEKENGK